LIPQVDSVGISLFLKSINCTVLAVNRTPFIIISLHFLASYFPPDKTHSPSINNKATKVFILPLTYQSCFLSDLAYIQYFTSDLLFALIILYFSQLLQSLSKYYETSAEELTEAFLVIDHIVKPFHQKFLFPFNGCECMIFLNQISQKLLPF